MENIDKNKVALITGGTSPIMKCVTLSLLQQGYHVVITTRDKSKVSLYDDVDKQLSARLRMMDLELSSIDSVKSFVSSFKKEYSVLHLLVAHAGVGANTKGITGDGYEKVFAINYLGHFVLIMGLLDLLSESGSADSASKLIITSSKTLLNKKIDYNYLASPGTVMSKGYARSLFVGYNYGVSNLCRMLLINHLSKNPPANVEISGVLPGFCITSCNLPRGGRARKVFERLYERFVDVTSPEEAARNYISLCEITSSTNGVIYNRGVMTRVDDWVPEDSDTAVLIQLSKRFAALVDFDNESDSIRNPIPLDKCPANITSVIDSIYKEKNPHRLPSVRRTGIAFFEHLANMYLIRNTHLRNKDILSICLDKNILKTVVELLDTTDIVMYRSNVFKVNPGGKGVGVWHADEHKIGVDTKDNKYLTVWVAFTDVDESNGFEYIHGSNEALFNGCRELSVSDPYKNSLFKVPEYIKKKYLRSTKLKKGEFIYFGNKLVHRTIPNASPNTRYALALRYVPQEATIHYDNVLTYKDDKVVKISTDRDAKNIDYSLIG